MSDQVFDTYLAHTARAVDENFHEENLIRRAP
jgi:hypothetical protein